MLKGRVDLEPEEIIKELKQRQISGLTKAGKMVERWHKGGKTASSSVIKEFKAEM